jgi:hypothetical protein
MCEKFTNARVHEWLTAALDATSEQTHATRLTLNSAALWWFLNRLTPAERAEVLGEHVKHLALLHQQDAQVDGRASGKRKGGQRKK